MHVGSLGLLMEPIGTAVERLLLTERCPATPSCCSTPTAARAPCADRDAYRGRIDVDRPPRRHRQGEHGGPGLPVPGRAAAGSGARRCSRRARRSSWSPTARTRPGRSCRARCSAEQVPAVSGGGHDRRGRRVRRRLPRLVDGARPRPGRPPRPGTWSAPRSAAAAAVAALTCTRPGADPPALAELTGAELVAPSRDRQGCDICGAALTGNDERRGARRRNSSAICRLSDPERRQVHGPGNEQPRAEDQRAGRDQCEQRRPTARRVSGSARRAGRRRSAGPARPAARRCPGGRRFARRSASGPARRPAARRRTAGTRRPRTRTPPRSAGPASQITASSDPPVTSTASMPYQLRTMSSVAASSSRNSESSSVTRCVREQRGGPGAEQRRRHVPGECGQHDARDRCACRGRPSRPRCPRAAGFPSSRRPDSSETTAWPPSCAIVITMRVSRHSRGLTTISSATAALTAIAQPGGASCTPVTRSQNTATEPGYAFGGNVRVEIASYAEAMQRIAFNATRSVCRCSVAERLIVITLGS